MLVTRLTTDRSVKEGQSGRVGTIAEKELNKPRHHCFPRAIGLSRSWRFQTSRRVSLHAPQTKETTISECRVNQPPLIVPWLPDSGLSCQNRTTLGSATFSTEPSSQPCADEDKPLQNGFQQQHSPGQCHVLVEHQLEPNQSDRALGCSHPVDTDSFIPIKLQGRVLKS